MTIETQWLTMVTMISSGVILGVILDIYRVLKERFRIRGWAVSLVDLLYWIISVGLVFSLLLWSNWGELRFYIFFAIILGFYLYYRWWSKETILVIKWMIRMVEKLLNVVVSLLYYLVWRPLEVGWHLSVKLGIAILKFIFVLLKILIAPLEWLTRPLRNRLLVLFYPLWIRIQYMSRNLHQWWLKFRKKDDPDD